MNNIRYGVKINDKTYSSSCFIDIDLKCPLWKHAYFSLEETFESEDAAKNFITEILRNPSDMNRWRDEVDETWFEIVPLYFSTFYKRYVTEDQLKISED